MLYSFCLTLAFISSLIYIVLVANSEFFYNRKQKLIGSILDTKRVLAENNTKSGIAYKANRFLYQLLPLSYRGYLEKHEALIGNFQNIIHAQLEIARYKKSIVNNLKHLLICLKILVINTETPLVSAIKIIKDDLPKTMQNIKKLLEITLNKSEKLGLKKALKDWDTGIVELNDFLALLLSIDDGANKQAILENIESFLERHEEERKELLKQKAENLQLYLMIPVIAMFLVALYPMVSAINFTMTKL